MNNHIPNQYKMEGGKLLANLLNFARLLRQLSIPIGSNQVHGLAQGLALIDITSEQDFYNTARTFLLHDNSKRQQFDLAFDLFWSSYIKIILDLPGDERKLLRQKLVPKESGELSREVLAELLDTDVAPSHFPDRLNESEIQVKPYYSPYEILRFKDFGEYDADEFHEAKKIIRETVWLLAQKRTRRKVRAVKKSKFLDFRSSIRNNINDSGELIDLEWQRNKYKSRPLIVLCDVSGSMEKYSQVFLHFLYAMVQETKRVETFIFGTRLTRLTTLLMKKNPDQVIENLSSTITDWSGGTRIGESIKDFNYHWARRVKCQGSIVMIISDGWDRGNLELLEKEIKRLSRTAHRLIWLNPLAGSEDYQPIVKGIQTVFPHLDDFYPLANLNDLVSLTKALNLNRR